MLGMLELLCTLKCVSESDSEQSLAAASKSESSVDPMSNWLLSLLDTNECSGYIFEGSREYCSLVSLPSHGASKSSSLLKMSSLFSITLSTQSPEAESLSSSFRLSTGMPLVDQGGEVCKSLGSRLFRLGFPGFLRTCSWKIHQIIHSLNDGNAVVEIIQTCMLPTSSIGCLRKLGMSPALCELAVEGEEVPDFILSLSGVRGRAI